MVVFGIAAALLLTGMLSMLFSRNADGWLKIVSYVVLALILVLGTFYLSFAAYNLVADWNGEISKDIRAYSVLTLGLPLAALGSLALVIVLPATSSEKLKFEGLSFKLEGPAVQIVLWVVCFFAIEGARNRLCVFGTKTEARREIFEYIETYYNNMRLHSALG
jgi:cytochrome bd-type quinol oxidase subunit 2